MELMTVSELGNQARLASLPIFLAFVGMVVLLSDLVFNRDDERRWPAYLTIAGLVGGLFLWLQSWLVYHQPQSDNAFFAAARRILGVQALPQPEPLFNGMYDPVGIGNLTLLVSLIAVIVALVVSLIAPPHLERRDIQRGEFYALILFCTVGLIFMAGSNHLIMIFLGIELLSLPLYILAGFARPALRSMESALKYFLLGAFASGFLLYGIALTYGATGSMDIVEIRNITIADFQSQAPAVLGAQGGSANLMLLAGFTMILVGLGFKLALVPFHQWTPDVYEGAPLPVTAYMIAGTKVGAFAALVNVLGGFVVLYEWWTTLLVILAILTMLVGNIGAIRQRNIKRMLAYSSIAHAGYILVGLTGLGSFQTAGLILPGLIFYLAVYALMNLGAFAVLIALEEATEREIVELEDFAGLGREHPVLGLLLGFFLLSLAGFPPTAGFFAKFFLFTGAVLGNQIWLVVVAVVLSVISMFYYARFIIAMFMTPRAEETAEPRVDRERPSWMVGAAVAVTALLILGLGIYPTPILSLFQ
jgi:NADH-quinone oxidoreductase subunit N